MSILLNFDYAKFGVSNLCLSSYRIKTSREGSAPPPPPPPPPVQKGIEKQMEGKIETWGDVYHMALEMSYALANRNYF